MTLYGADFSHFDSPNVSTLLAEGFSFATHKAGGDAIDPELSAWWSYVKTMPQGRVILGAYWVLYPGNPTGRADAFLARLDSQCPGWRDRAAFILQADCEVWNGDPATKPGLADVQAFCDRLHARTGLVPIVYASRGQYGDGLRGLTYPLWNANYPSPTPGFASALYAKAGGDTGPGWAAYSGQIPAIWQFSSAATIAGQTTCDADAYRGTLTQLADLVTGADMPLTDADATKVAQAVATKLHTDLNTAGSGLAKDVAGSEARVIGTLSTSLGAAIQALAAKDVVNESALAAELAPGVAAAVLAALPPTDDPISQDEVTTALRNVLHEAFSAGGA